MKQNKNGLDADMTFTRRILKYHQFRQKYPKQTHKTVKFHFLSPDRYVMLQSSQLDNPNKPTNHKS